MKPLSHPRRISDEGDMGSRKALDLRPEEGPDHLASPTPETGSGKRGRLPVEFTNPDHVSSNRVGRFYRVESWLPRHNLVAQLHALGMPYSEISEVTGYDKQTISLIVADPRARSVVEETLAAVAGNITDLNQRLQVHAVEALDEIVDELRTSRDERVRQKAAFGILDRAGYSPIQRQLVTRATIGDEAARRIEKAVSKLDVVEADYEVVEQEEATKEVEVTR